MRTPPALRIAPACALLFALALGACTTGPQMRTEPTTPLPSAASASAKDCASCGRVERVEVLNQTTTVRKPVGPMQGGVLGGVLSKPAAASTTSPPASTPTRRFRLSLRMDDGRRVVLEQASISPNLKIGSRVRVEKGRVVLLR